MTEDQALWDAYNLLCGGPDRERLRKLLVRYDLFRMAAPLPGDIVECGVFKGTGLMTWLKLLAIYQPGTEKRVVGFDVFSEFPEPAEEVDKAVVSRLVRESDFRGLKRGTLYGMVEAAGIPKSTCDLVDYRARIRRQAHRGFRISLLHLDLASPPTPRWKRCGPGSARGHRGLRRVRDSAVVRERGRGPFLASHDVTLRAVRFAPTPTAYGVKP